MRHAFVFIISTVLASSAARAQASAEKPGGERAKVEREIQKLEEHRFQAMIGVDLKTLDRLLADDLSYTHSSGKVDTKATFLAALRSGELKYESIRTEDIKARVYGNSAVVTGRGEIKVKSGNQELSFPIRFTDVYVKRAGRWVMVAWQSTRIAQQ